MCTVPQNPSTITRVFFRIIPRVVILKLYPVIHSKMLLMLSMSYVFLYVLESAPKESFLILFCGINQPLMD